MKFMKRVIVVAAASLSLVSSAFAGSGIFGSYVAIDADGPGSAVLTWYGAQQAGSNQLTAFDQLNLGSFAMGSQAYIAGAEIETYKNSGSDVTGATLFYRVDTGAWQNASIGFTANSSFANAAGNTFSGDGDQKWAQLSNTGIDFLSGVGVGQHTLQIYFGAGSTDGG